jgi:hypothetical protein
MKIYISGPMTGIEEFNYPAFNQAAKWLRALGHTVLNPAELFGGDLTQIRPRSVYMRADIIMLLQADAVATLPRWSTSKGACLEVRIVRELGINVQPLRSFLDACEWTLEADYAKGEATRDAAEKFMRLVR